MTKLTRPVRREILTPEIGQWFPKGLVVELAPSGILKIQGKGPRFRYLEAQFSILKMYGDYVGVLWPDQKNRRENDQTKPSGPA